MIKIAVPYMVVNAIAQDRSTGLMYPPGGTWEHEAPCPFCGDVNMREEHDTTNAVCWEHRCPHLMPDTEWPVQQDADAFWFEGEELEINVDEQEPGACPECGLIFEPGDVGQYGAVPCPTCCRRSKDNRKQANETKTENHQPPRYLDQCLNPRPCGLLERNPRGIRTIIFVRQGVVEGVFASAPLDVSVCDYDDLQIAQPARRRQEIESLGREARGLKSVY